MLELLKQPSLSGTQPPPHPFDPLSAAEIEYAIAVVSKLYGQLRYNAISLSEPKKAEMLAWLAAPDSVPRPRREAEVVVIDKTEVYDGIVDLVNGKIVVWEKLEGVQPMVSSFLGSSGRSVD